MSGNHAEEAPTWDELCFAARVAGLRLDFFDSSQVSAARRLKYEEFEELFYQLLLLIDPKETKRRLKKSRWPEERARFIESLTRLLNDTKLLDKKVTTSQFKSYGGEVFRRLLGALMKSACERQATQLRAKRLSTPSGGGGESRPPLKQMRSNSIQEVSDKLERDETELKELCNKLARLRTRIGELKRDDDALGHHRQDSVQEMDMCNQLLSRLEKAASETNGALDKLRAMELPAINRVKNQGGEQRLTSEKRLSQFIREVKARNNPNREHREGGESGDSGKSLGERIGKQISEYDDKMSQLLDKLRSEADFVDEMMLKKPEILKRFTKLEQMIPSLEIPVTTTLAEMSEAPDVETLAKVLAKFPDPTCDDQQALDVYRGILDKNRNKI